MRASIEVADIFRKAEVFVRRAGLGLDIGYTLRDSNQVSAARAYLDSIRFNMRAQTIYEKLKSPRRSINHEKVLRATRAYLSFI